jgi:hypothetical protein
MHRFHAELNPSSAAGLFLIADSESASRDGSNGGLGASNRRVYDVLILITQTIEYPAPTIFVQNYKFPACR